MTAGGVYIVTGGASGIGLAVARKQLNLAITVHLIDVQQPVNISVADKQAGQLHLYLGADVSCSEHVTKVFGRITDRSSRIDGLVNCAGIGPREPSLLESDEQFRRIMAVNAEGVWNAGTAYQWSGSSGKWGLI